MMPRPPALRPRLRPPHRAAAAALLLLAPRALWAQEPPRDAARAAGTVGTVPPAVVSAALAAWNAPGTRRLAGDTLLAPADTLRGALALRDGLLRLRGVVAGTSPSSTATCSCSRGARCWGASPCWGGA